MKYTLPDMLIQKAGQYGETKTALREKEFSIWKEVTWGKYLENVRNFSLGLYDLGIKKGDVVAFISDNRPEWMYTELGAQCIGAISLGLYSDMENLEQLQYLLDFSDTRIIMTENQEQTDKILAVKDKLPKLEKIIVDDFDEVDGYENPELISFRDILDRGAGLHQKDGEIFRKKVADIENKDVAIMSTTSGTTGLPKLALLTHRNLIHMAKGLAEVDPIVEGDEFVSFLPPAWIGERMLSLGWSLFSGFTVNFPERPETVRRDIREIGPSIMLAPPRIWEKMLADVIVKIQDASALKRKIYQFFLPRSERVIEKTSENVALSLSDKALQVVANTFVFRKLRDHLGLTRLRIVYTGGAPLGDDTFRFFQMMRVKIKQVYGQTEIGGIATVHRSDDVRVETVGQPLPETEVRISDIGEVLFKSDAVCKGYYNNPKATEETIVDGWLCSGDQGYLDDGHLVIIDRMGDVMELVGGKKFSPQYIENKMKFSPYIREAIVLGHQLKYVAALIQIDMDVVGKWAEDNQIPYTTFEDLSQKTEVFQLISDEVNRLNKKLPDVARVEKFCLLSKELDPEDDELTQTQKLRRNAIVDKYITQIQSLYPEEDIKALTQEV
ncbi:MAG: AMP-binding protein [Thermodesulfobacteriota bacterium]|nr:AMP-binding protein [Thermodesulfobacteriota bacterium]